jgi:hypothetical protein
MGHEAAGVRKKKKVVRDRGLRSKPARQKTNIPKNERDKKFCERWLVHHDHNKAIIEAGFSDKNSHNLGLRKLEEFRPYLERLLPKVELEVAKRLGFERGEILEAIARIGNCNALDYIKPYTVINQVTGMMEQRWGMKSLHELTRDQAAAVDKVYFDGELGAICYSLPAAKTRLSAMTTLGEQAANFKKPGAPTHNHLHFHDVPLEKIRQIKQMLIEAIGPKRAHLAFRTEAEAEQIES